MTILATDIDRHDIRAAASYGDDGLTSTERETRDRLLASAERIELEAVRVEEWSGSFEAEGLLRRAAKALRAEADVITGYGEQDDE